MAGYVAVTGGTRASGERPARWAWIIEDGNGQPVAGDSSVVDAGLRPSASVARYTEMIAALEHAASMGVGLVEVRSTSKRVVGHLTGDRECPDPQLRVLRDRARRLLGDTPVRWTPRAQSLAAALDRAGTTTTTSRSPSSSPVQVAEDGGGVGDVRASRDTDDAVLAQALRELDELVPPPAPQASASPTPRARLKVAEPARCRTEGCGAIVALHDMACGTCKLRAVAL